MKLQKEDIDSLESTLSNAIHGLSEGFSNARRDAILIEYYEFEKKLHEIIHSEYPEIEFDNFG